MKVLRVINSLKIGGAERSIVNNVPHHIKNGIEIDVLLLDGSKTYFYDEIIDENVKVHFISDNNNIYNPFLIFKICRFINKYDIVHGHLFPTLYWLGFAKLITNSKVKLVFTEHSTNNRRRDNWFFKIVDRVIYNQYSSIITISKAADNNLLKSLGGKNLIKTTIINNGVDLAKVREEALIVNQDLINKYGKFKIILQIAAFRAEKDQDTVIKSLLYLPDDYCIIFIGDGVRKSNCIKLANKLGVSSRVVFLGIQNNIGSIINISDIVVVSSHWEGFGRAAVEGMALGKPVIASNVDGLCDVVQDAGLLFEVGDSKELSILILNVMNDKNYYQLISDKCKVRAEEYDIKKMVREYENIYYALFKES